MKSYLHKCPSVKFVVCMDASLPAPPAAATATPTADATAPAADADAAPAEAAGPKLCALPEVEALVRAPFSLSLSCCHFLCVFLVSVS